MNRNSMSKHILSAMIQISFILFLVVPVFASSHYPPGNEGVMAGTVPPQGFHWAMFTNFYNTDSTTGSNGHEANLDFDLNVIANVHRMIYVTDYKIFGADYFIGIVLPVTYTDLQIKTPDGAMTLTDDKKIGIGDITLDFISLAWHKPGYDATFGLSIVVPSGEYDATEDVNLGLGYTSGMLTLGGTYYFDNEKTWSISALSRYLIHGEQEYTDIHYGDEFIVEAGIGKSLMISPSLQIRPGIAGFGYLQVTDDSGRNADETRDAQKFGIGPEINFFWLPPTLFHANLRVLWEFDAQNETEGQQFVLTLRKSF